MSPDRRAGRARGQAVSPQLRSISIYSNDGEPRDDTFELGRLNVVTYLSCGMDRCAIAARCLVGKERVAMRRGKTGAALPAIIWTAGIISSRPAMIESPVRSRPER